MARFSFFEFFIYLCGAQPINHTIMNTTQQPSLRFYLLNVVCLGILFLVGCSDKAALESVDYVLHNAQQEPVEALERIRSVDKNSIRGKHNRARYALAYSEALYYNRINSDCDTLVRPLFEYYHDSDNHEERARALYQYALVKYNSNQFTDALFAIEEAFESLDIVEDNKLRGLLYRIEGNIYNNELLFHNAYEAHLNSIEYFKKENLSAHSAYSMSFAGAMASRNDDFANAEVILSQAMAEAINIDDKILLCDVLYELCRIYIQIDELAKCESTLCLLETYNCAIYYESDFNCIRAILEAKKGNINLANDYLVNAENCQTEYDNLLDYAKYVVALLSNDSDMALSLYHSMISQQNKLVRSALELPILNKQLDYLHISMEQTVRENKLIRQRNTIFYITILLIIVAACVYLRLYMRNKQIEQQQTVAQYIETINILQAKNITLSSEVHQEVFTLYSNYFDDINCLCETLYSHGTTSRESVKILDKVKTIIDDMRNDSERMQKLEQVINIHNNDIISRLRNEACFNDREIRFIVYSILGFSSASISLLLNIKTSAVWRLKYNIKHKIISATNVDVEEIF